MRDCILTDDDVLFTSRRTPFDPSKWHLDMCVNQGLKRRFFVSIWTSAGEFWTNAVQEQDKLSNDR